MRLVAQREVKYPLGMMLAQRLEQKPRLRNVIERGASKDVHPVMLRVPNRRCEPITPRPLL